MKRHPATLSSPNTQADEGHPAIALYAGPLHLAYTRSHKKNKPKTKNMLDNPVTV